MKLIWKRSNNTGYVLVAVAPDGSWYGIKRLGYGMGFKAEHIINRQIMDAGFGRNLNAAKLAARAHAFQMARVAKDNPSKVGWAFIGASAIVFGPFIVAGLLWGLLSVADEIKYGHTWNG